MGDAVTPERFLLIALLGVALVTAVIGSVLISTTYGGVARTGCSPGSVEALFMGCRK